MSAQDKLAEKQAEIEMLEAEVALADAKDAYRADKDSDQARKAFHAARDRVQELRAPLRAGTATTIGGDAVPTKKG